MYVSAIFQNLGSTVAGTGFMGPFSPTDEYVVGGFYTPGDGGGGIFVWIPVSITNPDGGITINNANYTAGHFKRIYSGPINVKWFGAKGTGGLGLGDDTVAVHNARDSKDFANNGTLYFPVGTYIGAFVFDYNPSKHLNEISIVGDGHGTVLISNGTHDPISGYNNPVLRLGYREGNWQWARVSNLTIDGSYLPDPYFTFGVMYDNPNYPSLTGRSGRWVFERVLFINCDKAVYKPTGDIGNHYIDCTWENNIYGVYAVAGEGGNNGSDRYSGCHFSGTKIAAIAYGGTSLGQIIFDGTLFENNEGVGISMVCTSDSRLLRNAMSIRNVYFEGNSGGDLYFDGVKSVRIDDSFISTMELIDASVNMFNCRQDGYFYEGQEYGNIKVNDKSSVVAYEHRYKGYPGDKIFVNSISYDNSPEPGNGDSTPKTPTSVWGPLRVVESSKSFIVVSEQFDTVPEPFEDYGGGGFVKNSVVDQMRVLGKGSGKLSLSAGQWLKWMNLHCIIEQHDRPRYCVWSIHTYLQSNPLEQTIPEWKIYGMIYSEDPATQIQLGNVYFKPDQWVCSYGMKLVDTSHPLIMRLAFRAIGYDASFYFTDFQIVMFDDLHSANSFVNSREFAKWPIPDNG